MELKVLADQIEVAQFAHEWVTQKVNTTKANSLYLPAGETPKELYKLWEDESPDFLKHLNFIQIDDVRSGKKAGTFKKFFLENLPSLTQQFIWIEEKQKYQAKLALLGLGLNGHIAFHEPELPDDFSFQEVSLSVKSIKTLGLEEGAKGFSYGIKDFLNCEAILLMVTGENKKAILKRLLDKDPTITASKLLGHSGLTLVCDQATLTQED